jgi:hypothetical protein
VGFDRAEGGPPSSLKLRILRGCDRRNSVYRLQRNQFLLLPNHGCRLLFDQLVLALDQGILLPGGAS